MSGAGGVLGIILAQRDAKHYPALSTHEMAESPYRSEAGPVFFQCKMLL